MVQADRLIRELKSSNRLLKSELQATTTTFKQALHAAQTMLDTGMFAPLHQFLNFDRMGACICMCTRFETKTSLTNKANLFLSGFFCQVKLFLLSMFCSK